MNNKDTKSQKDRAEAKARATRRAVKAMPLIKSVLKGLASGRPVHPEYAAYLLGEISDIANIVDASRKRSSQSQ